MSAAHGAGDGAGEQATQIADKQAPSPAAAAAAAAVAAGRLDSAMAKSPVEFRKEKERDPRDLTAAGATDPSSRDVRPPLAAPRSSKRAVPS